MKLKENNPGLLSRVYTCGPNAGFTLIEILVVVALMMVVLTLSFTTMSGSFKNLRLRTETKKLTTSLRFVRSLAVTHGVPFVLEVGTDGESYRIYPLYNSASKPVKLKGKIATRLISGIRLPEKISIRPEDDQDNYLLHPAVNRNNYSIIYYSKGNSSGGLLSVNYDEAKKYIVDVTPVTGRIRVDGPYGSF